MASLDIRTLLVAASLVYLVMGALTYSTTAYGRRSRTLNWVAVACILGGVAFLIGLFSSPEQYQHSTSIWLSNMFLVSMHACLWTAMRRFAGKGPRWIPLLGGAVIWGVLCLWPLFLEWSMLRAITFSALVVLYGLGIFIELLPRWRADHWLVTPVLTLIVAHMLFYIHRVLAYAHLAPPWPLPDDFSITVLENMAFVISITMTIVLMVRARTEQLHEHAALHDALTALPNRRALFSHGIPLLAQCIRSGQDLALLISDMDRFKHINDFFGHDAGDRMLRLFADAIRSGVRRNDLCARLGGDEFVILCPDTDASSAQRLAQRIASEPRFLG